MSEQNNNNTASKKRTFILDGKVSEESVRKIAESIIEINRTDAEIRYTKEDFIEIPIQIIVNTYGGSLYDANMLVGIIETSETPIHTYCYGKAMSAGFLIFASGHKRFAYPLATFMYHDASVGIHNTIEGLKEDLKQMINVRDTMDAYLLSVTNLPKETMDEYKKHKDNWYMDGVEAIQYGVADEILPLRKR